MSNNTFKGLIIGVVAGAILFGAIPNLERFRQDKEKRDDLYDIVCSIYWCADEIYDTAESIEYTEEAEELYGIYWKVQDIERKVAEIDQLVDDYIYIMKEDYSEK